MQKKEGLHAPFLCVGIAASLAISICVCFRTTATACADVVAGFPGLAVFGRAGVLTPYFFFVKILVHAPVATTASTILLSIKTISHFITPNPLIKITFLCTG
jgi:hypothetical protein